jgi:HEAT repeat protein
MRAEFALGAVALGVLSACVPPVPEGFNSPDPTRRLNAIVAAADEQDTSAIPQLIVQLESSDPAARLLAIRTLESLTGETLGYDPIAPDWQRAEAVDRWQVWAQENDLVSDSE